MIVVERSDSLLVITQGDHAALAAEILALCRFPDLMAHPRRESLLEAVREHDNGWREADAAPTIDPQTGRPCSFLDLPDHQRREIWGRGCRRFAATDSWVALLITRWALELHSDREGDAWAAWLDATRRLHDELAEATGEGVDTLDREVDLLRFADGCSLALCGATSDAFDAAGVRARPAGDSLALDPLPLAGATTFRIPCRTIPRRRYTSDRDLGGELVTARWTRRTVRTR